MSKMRYLIPQLAVLIAPTANAAPTCDPNTVNELLKLGADPALVVSRCQTAAASKSNPGQKNAAAAALPVKSAADTSATPAPAAPAAAVQAAAAPAAQKPNDKGNGSDSGNDKGSDSPNYFAPGQWGLGLAVLRNSHNVINDASIQNGLVRASAESRTATEIVMTRSFYFTKQALGSKDPNERICSTADWKMASDFCMGLFLAVGVNPSSGNGNGSSNLIDMIGGGLIFGFGKVKDGGPFDKQHNIGFGIGRRFGVKTLGDGFSHNNPPPTGETQVRYKTTDFTAPFLFYTYNFSQTQ